MVRKLVSTLLIVTLLTTPTFAKQKYTKASPDDVKEGIYYEVLKVTDGDTFDIKVNDKEKQTIRMLDIDTPESKHKKKELNNEYGKKASEITNKLLKDKKVKLVFDKEKTDSYKRILAVVYTDNNTKIEDSINAKLVKEGFARVDKYGKNKTYYKPLKEIEKGVIKKQIGIWESWEVFKKAFPNKKVPKEIKK